MIFFASLLKGIAWLLNNLIWFYMLVMIAKVVVSWVNADPYNPIVRFISALTDPPCAWLRRRLPIAFGGIDFSPMILMLLLGFIQVVVVESLYGYAISFQRAAF